MDVFFRCSRDDAGSFMSFLDFQLPPADKDLLSRALFVRVKNIIIAGSSVLELGRRHFLWLAFGRRVRHARRRLSTFWRGSSGKKCVCGR